MHCLCPPLKINICRLPVIQSLVVSFDIVMLLYRLTDVTIERKKNLPIVSRISLKYDTVLSIVSLDFDEFHRKRMLLILNVSKEGIQL